ncbi:MAG: hypothetical protein B7Y80_19365 [Hyphomicrobium sp. 32-62-53]|nr:MAG: hypothetical protein B7Z29_17840 [Hyphomicrobium sp. 12-62-95]OYX97579.1 MAG: hypothetical protein B7Y80_19365 [Hyphomicrobium sp. 32-62-53]
MTAIIYVFPLAAQRQLDPVSTAHELGQTDPAKRTRAWRAWSRKTQKKLIRRGVPPDTAHAALVAYSAAIRSAACRLGYVQPTRDRDRAS